MQELGATGILFAKYYWCNAICIILFVNLVQYYVIENLIVWTILVVGGGPPHAGVRAVRRWCARCAAMVCVSARPRFG